MCEVESGVFLVRDVLSRSTCERLKTLIDSRILKSGTRNKRDGFYHEKMRRADCSERLYESVRQFLPPQWNICGACSCVRIARYSPNQQVGLHTDNTHTNEVERVRSRASMLVYLNDDFQKGETIFYDQDFKETTRVSPMTGCALVFDIGKWHSGSRVSNGYKYWIGTDLLCKY